MKIKSGKAVFIVDSKTVFKAGAVSVDITPQKPAALVGQYYFRLAREVFSPLQANILAMESGGQPVIFVACDLLGVPAQVVREAREMLKQKDSSFPTENVIFTAIHTHTAPFLVKNAGSDGWGEEFDWKRHDPEELTPDEYRGYVIPRIVDGILEAWSKREPARLATGMDHASISYCRRTVYKDGTAVMYGNTNRPDFVRMESAGDDGLHFAAVESRATGKLMAAMIEVACPSQVLEHHDYISSDFWHNVRCKLKATYGDQTVVLGLCGAAGDLAPRDLVRMAMPEPDMHARDMYQPEGAEKIGQELSDRFDRFMKNRISKEDAEVLWGKRWLDVPIRTVTEEEKNVAEIEWKKYRALHENMLDFEEMESYAMSIEAGIKIRWVEQQKAKTHSLEIHAVKLGDMEIATNPFELYVEYADRIRSRRGGGNVMIIQLANDYMGYLPTAPAIAHGGYSALVCNGHFDDKGGDMLVEETLDLLNDVCPKKS